MMEELIRIKNQLKEGSVTFDVTIQNLEDYIEVNKGLNISNETLQQAIAKWGVDPQIEMIVEECSELIQAIQKLKRNPFNPVAEANVCDEIADVKIMLRQAELIFDKKLIDKRIEFKLKRLEERLKSK